MKLNKPLRICVELELDVDYCEYNNRIEVDVVRSPGQGKNLFLHLDQISQIKVQAEAEAALAAAEQEKREARAEAYESRNLRMGSYIAPLRVSGSDL